MATSSEPVLLDLRRLHEQCELLPVAAEYIATAASVVLERRQGVGQVDEATVEGGGAIRDATIWRGPVDEQGRRTFADLQEATEKGAEAMAILVAKAVLNRVVTARLPIGTGADYKMEIPGAPASDDYERLECSGIGEGEDSVEKRLREKLAQLAKFPSQPRGTAVVTRFRSSPVEIRYEEWTP